MDPSVNPCSQQNTCNSHPFIHRSRLLVNLEGHSGQHINLGQKWSKSWFASAIEVSRFFHYLILMLLVSFLYQLMSSFVEAYVFSTFNVDVIYSIDF
jgi:hypothetical protein